MSGLFPNLFFFFFFNCYSMLRLILRGLGYSAVTWWHWLDCVPPLEDRRHNHVPASPLALLKKSGLATNSALKGHAVQSVVWCWAWGGTTLSGPRRMAGEGWPRHYVGVTHGLSPPAVSTCFFLITFRTGSQKWIWRDKKVGERASEPSQMPPT